MSNSNLEGARLEQISFVGIDFSNANLRNVFCTGCTFAHSDFTGADLTNFRCTVFCNFEGATFSNTTTTGMTCGQGVITCTSGAERLELFNGHNNCCGIGN